ncbi:MAG: NVEALA domain-containing protein [Phocaeicola sp.]|nr:NVEALA domain-containing protein [Phocaeicola sp.]
MKKSVFKFLFAAVFTMTAGHIVYSSQQNTEMSDLALANIEALAGEVIQGAVCFYKGNELYEKRIPCKADYPNICPCGEPEYGFYSSNRAQCAK